MDPTYTPFPSPLAIRTIPDAKRANHSIERRTDLIPLYVIFITILSAATLFLFYHRRDKQQKFQASAGEREWIKVNIVSDEGIQTTTFMYGSVGEAGSLLVGHMGSDAV